MITALYKEIKLIKDPYILNIVTKTLEHAPTYFWSIPGSSTGKRHSPEDNVVGGLIIHTRKAVKIGLRLCEAFDVKFSYERDLVIASLILHDVTKRGYPIDTGKTLNGHPYLVSEVMKDAGIDIRENMPKSILKLISTHMGIFELPYEMPTNSNLAKIVHLSDYFVAQRCVSINLEVEECEP
jgi:23S rRNA maturation-related 3'-5' exoribonuclease YhaM